MRYEEATYPSWFFLARPELVDGLPVQELDASVLATGGANLQGSVGLVKLAGDNHFGYLVLTDQLDEVERRVIEAARQGHEEGRFTEPLSQLIYVRPALEQYLTISGRTYYQGMSYHDVRRLQFDLETSGLDANAHHIFMVAIRDSDGFATILDTTSMSEAELIGEFVRIVRERDPDIIENHNIFEFDIRFLVRRAHALGVPLPLGRDGSTFTESRDSVKVGAINEGFTRFSLVGREIVDTFHATKRYSAIQRDLRSNGLKEAARYFGVAPPDRVYLEGAEVYPTFLRDPALVRAYCMNDVEEVASLSTILLGPSFALASMVPKSYERIATAGTGQGLIEPLLVRAYLAGGHSLPSGQAVGSFAGGRTGIFATGIVDNVVKADVASLYPSIMLAERIAPASDQAGAFLTLLEELTGRRLHHKAQARNAELSADERRFEEAMQGAMKVLINSFYGMLGASFALFCDKSAAEQVTARGRDILQMVLDGLEARSAILIEADTDGVLFSLPTRADGEPWSYQTEAALIDEVAGLLPAGIHLEHDGRYRSMYSYMEKNYALLDYSSDVEPTLSTRVRLVGSAFRSTKLEPFIDHFLSQALLALLRGDVSSLQQLYRATCADLRAGRVPVADLCVTMPLTKDPEKYASSERKEEPYEVWINAGNPTWKTGTRIRYYQTRSGKRLLSDPPSAYDAAYYVDRLRTASLQRLDKALDREDLEAVLSESPGLFDPLMENVRPLVVKYVEPLETATPASPLAEPAPALAV